MLRSKPRRCEALIPSKNRKISVPDLSTNYRVLTLEQFIDEMRAIKAGTLDNVIELDQASSE